MAFRFSLATVLRFRGSMEKREETALKKILMEIARTRHQIEQLAAEIALKQEALNKTMQEPLTAGRFRSLLSEVDVVVNRKIALLESLEPMERRRQAQMRAYQAAHRDRQMLSEMATRQQDEYDREQARAQQKFLDDIFAARAQRN